MLECCNPQAVFRIFEEFCAVPHPSHHTEAATEFCLAYAKKIGLPAHRDTAGNVVIRKQGTPGKENAKTVILQGHIDMVAEKEPGCPTDFLRDGLDLFLDGDFIGARGTTLGGDNGIAVAMVLAILGDNTLSHPPIEAVFTVDEEVGMLGADAMDMSTLTGRYLLNLDSEEEGVLTVSCAGGATATLALSAEKEMYTGTVMTVSLTGLQGGHSGAEIHRGRANAARMLAELCRAVSLVGGVHLCTVDGGLKDNAIPAHASCRFAVEDREAALSTLLAFCEKQKAEYAERDPGLAFQIDSMDGTVYAFSPADSDRILSLLCSTPCGVQKMSEDIPGLVQTSLNLGILETVGGRVRAVYSVRSSVGAEKDALLATIEENAKAHGASYRVDGAYPAWEYRKECPLRETVLATYRRLYGKDMKVEAIHAGLECGLFCDRIPGLYCVSLGPNMRDIHTPRERLSVSSVKRTYEFVCEILAAIE